MSDSLNVATSGVPIIAPFWADVDTRSGGSPVTYGTGTVGTHAAFGVNWVNVNYYNAFSHTPRYNSFQLVLIERSDTGTGNFDIEFNYDQILWESGQASGGNASGLGGFSARAGYSNGTVLNSYEFPGSAVNGAFLDSGPAATSLIHNTNTGNPALNGRYLFTARNGDVVEVEPVPEPASLTLLSIGGIGMVIGAVRRRRQKQTV